jgi:hypothetical protein
MFKIVVGDVIIYRPKVLINCYAVKGTIASSLILNGLSDNHGIL